MKWPPDGRSLRIYGPLLFLVGVFVMLLAIDADAGDTTSVVVTLALLALILLVVAQRMTKVTHAPGQSVGGGVFYRSMPLRPEEFVIEEIGEASTWPKRIDKLVVTNQRLMTIQGRTYFPMFGHKALSIEISDIRHVATTRSKWYAAWFDRPRIRISTDTTHHELWPGYGEDAAEFEERLRAALTKHGWTGQRATP
jgi:hypothetical protein